MGESELLATSSRLFAYPGSRALPDRALSSSWPRSEMQSVAVGWQVYEITSSTAGSGIGRARATPAGSCSCSCWRATLPTRHDRRRLLNICHVGFVVCSGALFAAAGRCGRSLGRNHDLPAITFFCWASCAASTGRPGRALLPQLVPRTLLLEGGRLECEHASRRQPSTLRLRPLAACCTPQARDDRRSLTWTSHGFHAAVALVGDLAYPTRSPAKRGRRTGEMSLRTVMAGFAFMKVVAREGRAGIDLARHVCRAI